MKRYALLFAVLLCCSATMAQDNPARPKILGIAAVHLYSTDATGARDFYSQVFSLGKRCPGCNDVSLLTMRLNLDQLLFVVNRPSPAPPNLLADVTFSTDDLEAMSRFLTSKKVAFSVLKSGPIVLTDPESHRIVFVKELHPSKSSTLDSENLHLIHAGFIVHDRAATEHFYKDILGFRPYWHGGMKDDQTDWVSMQVPDGTDWLEFMVNVNPDADQRLRGIMNHIAIGVPDIHAAEKKLQENGVKLTEEPKIGRDGKWQLNLYDPDDTRIEFMEFTPVQKPCCSEFTGPHPSPQSPSKAPAKP